MNDFRGPKHVTLCQISQIQLANDMLYFMHLLKLNHVIVSVNHTTT